MIRASTTGTTRLGGAIAILDDAITLVRKGWVTKAWAATDDGAEVDLYDPAATRWCGEAALMLATDRSRERLDATPLDREAAWRAAVDAAELLYGVTDLSDVNDLFGREAMVAVFAKAKEVLRENPDQRPEETTEISSAVRTQMPSQEPGD